MAETAESARGGGRRLIGDGAGSNKRDEPDSGKDDEGAATARKNHKGPKAPPLSPDKFTIHILRLGTGDDEEITPNAVRRRILDDFPLLLPHMKRGDAVENLDGGGYRSQGTYFVDAVDADAATLTIVDRDYDVDEYGSQPAHFTTLDGGFPPDYFNPETAQTNDMYLPGQRPSLYWHTGVGGGWSIFSEALASQIVVDEGNPNHGRLEYDGTTYRFLALEDGRVDDGRLVASEYDAETNTFRAGYC